MNARTPKKKSGVKNLGYKVGLFSCFDTKDYFGKCSYIFKIPSRENIKFIYNNSHDII